MTDATRFAPAAAVLRDGIARHVFPAATVEVGTAAGPRWREAFGTLTYDGDAPPAAVDTVFDLASLTKVLATAPLAMTLVDEGRLNLDERLATCLPGWRAPDRTHVTVRDLLEHASGLPPTAPLPAACRDREALVAALSALPLEFAPRSRSVYSDLGFILLALLLESTTGCALDTEFDALRARLSTAPAALALRFRPPASWQARTAPTRFDDKRGLLVGQVDDAAAWALGGVAGHAGLFGTVEAVGAFARHFLAEATGAVAPHARLWHASTIETWLRRSSVPGSSRALGWDTMLPTSSCGRRMSPRAFGHTGFTGTSLWLDPAHHVYVVLLTNRVHPQPQPMEAIQGVRRAFHDAVVDHLFA
jgi:serine-type D-Ala-D-Ala carboxypeptidase